MLRAIAGSTAALETLTLRSRGAKVRMIGPTRDIARVMGPNLMDARLREQVLAGGYAQGTGDRRPRPARQIAAATAADERLVVVR